jgi:hypothetical protein
LESNVAFSWNDVIEELFNHEDQILAEMNNHNIHIKKEGIHALIRELSTNEKIFFPPSDLDPKKTMTELFGGLTSKLNETFGSNLDEGELVQLLSKIDYRRKQ